MAAAIVGAFVVPKVVATQGPSSIERAVDSSVMFEVASLKPNELGPESELSSFRRGRFTARYATLKGLIRSAYGRPERPLAASQVIGGPGWLAFDRFDVLATAPNTPDSPRGSFDAPVLAMLRNLLEERFRLTIHVETKEYPLFALVLARSDGRLGPGLRRRAEPCLPAPLDERGPTGSLLPARRTCGGRVGAGTLTANGVTMTNLAVALSQLIPDVDRIIVDRTGLLGTFDVDLRWAMETPLPRAPGAAPMASAEANAPALFTALREQLGLELERSRGPVDVLVIDRVERPTPD